MLFNSLQFALFFIVFCSIYYLLPHKWQNRYLLLASYVFYSFWDWRFLSLILISTTVDYFCGIKIEESTNAIQKKRFLYTSIFVNLSILGIFKYFNFFAYNLQSLLKLIGLPIEPYIFNIILPVGISFYTFKTVTYAISIYSGQMKPTRNFFDYALFVAFFPTLLSGPIDRAGRFLPQITSPRIITASKIHEGGYLIFWGLFLKIVISDNLVKLVDPVFSSSPPYYGSVVLLTSYVYVFQLYCDFAGYSNIAIGLGKLIGFDCMINFNFPLFAPNVADFWRRWHISLSTWVRDYIYMPLYLSLRNVKEKKRLSITVITTMVILGLWHGAGWSYVVYGLYYGTLLAVYSQIQPALTKRARNNKKSRAHQNISLVLRIIFMFHISAIGFLLFSVNSVQQIYEMLYSLFFNFNASAILNPGNIIPNPSEYYLLYLSAFLMSGLTIYEIVQYRQNNQLVIFKWPVLRRALFYFVCFYLMVLYGLEGGKEFVYFQF